MSEPIDVIKLVSEQSNIALGQRLLLERVIVHISDLEAVNAELLGMLDDMTAAAIAKAKEKTP